MHTAVRRQLIAQIRDHLANGTTAMSNTVFTNPVSAYASRDRHELERQTLFRNQPLLIGLSCQLPKPGDYLTDDFSGTPLLLVRQPDGTLLAFINACGHRGAPIAEGGGNKQRSFTCPYHAWTYALDGQLLNIPGEPGFADINKHDYGLKPIPVIEKHGMIWVTPNPAQGIEPIDIDAYLDGLGDEFSSFSFEGYHHFATRVLEPKINWKMGIDGFLETYHLRVLHPKTVGPLYHTNLATADAFGLHHRMVGVRKTFAGVESESELEQDFLQHTIELYTLFPNTMFVYQMDHLEVWRLFPSDNNPSQCKMVLSLYTPEPVTGDSAQRHWDNNLRLALATVEAEDLPLGEKIQRGYRRGVPEFVTYGRNEPALTHFHTSLEKAMGLDQPT